MRRLTAVLLVAAACGSPDARVAPAQPGQPAQPGSGGGEPAGAPAAGATGPADGAPALRLDRSVVPIEYAVDLTLDPAKDDFAGIITIQAEVAQATTTVWMHGKLLAVGAATIGGQPAEVSQHGELLRLALKAPAAVGPTTIRIEYRGKLPTDDQEGLFRQSEAGATYLYSQFEATGARRAFPCFDEPSFKVPWQLTLHVPPGMVALSNTPLEREADEAGLHTLVFARTRPLPSYLVALAVGPFDLVDLGRAGRNKIPMRIAVPKGRGAETRYAKQVTGQLLEALEAYLDTPYPYEKLDSVAIPTFLGAMENPGLITYAEKIILAKPSEESIDFQRGYASTAAHELAHHWFGDLVTMAWWDDIWLNESFADFLADRVVDDWQPSWGTRLHRLQSAQGAFAADSLISARKIHNPIKTHNDIVGVFDSISYAKGGSVLAMFEAWVGRELFQKTLHDYLAAHAWGNASSQDFIAALAAVSKPEVSTAFASFLDQGGIPMVSLELACTGDQAEVVLAQERFLPIGSTGSADRTWTIPMCVGVPDGKRTATQCFLFSAKAARVPLDGPGCPAWVDGNPGGRGYYRVRYAPGLGPKLLASSTIDSVSRAAALFNLRAMVDGGHLPMPELLAVIPDVARDRNPELLSVALDLATDIDPYVDDPLRPNYLRFLGKSFAGPARQLGWKPRKGEAALAASLRPKLLAVAALLAQDPRLVAEARKLGAGYLARPTSLDPRIAAIALGAATRGGDDALARRLEPAFKKSDDKNLRAALLAGMVLARDPAVRARAIAQLGGGELSLEELFTLVFSAASDPVSRDEVFGYVTEHLDQVMAALPFLVRPAIVRFATFYCDDAHRAQLDQVFAPKLSDLPGGAKELGETREAMDLCIAKRKALGPAVSTFLGGQ